MRPLDPQDDNARWRRSFEYGAQIERFNRLAKGANKEQLDAEIRESDAKAETLNKAREERRRVGPRTQEEMNKQLVAWDLRNTSREEQDQLARMYGFHAERPVRAPLIKLPSWAEPLVKRQPPRNQEEMDKLLRHWQRFEIFNQREQNEVARMYGFGERPEVSGRHDGFRDRRPSRSPPAKGTTRKTRGRITKSTRRKRSNNQSANTREAPAQPRERRHKTYTKERASRRLAASHPSLACY